MSLEDGLEAKDEGMAAAIAAAHQVWKVKFRDVVEAYAGWGIPFTSEDITEVVGLPHQEVATNRNNAVGAMMNAAARTGRIVKTGRRLRSRRTPSHAAELVEWVGSKHAKGAEQ